MKAAANSHGVGSGAADAAPLSPAEAVTSATGVARCCNGVSVKLASGGISLNTEGSVDGLALTVLTKAPAVVEEEATVMPSTEAIAAANEAIGT